MVSLESRSEPYARQAAIFRDAVKRWTDKLDGRWRDRVEAGQPALEAALDRLRRLFDDDLANAPGNVLSEVDAWEKRLLAEHRAAEARRRAENDDFNRKVAEAKQERALEFERWTGLLQLSDDELFQSALDNPELREFLWPDEDGWKFARDNEEVRNALLTQGRTKIELKKTDLPKLRQDVELAKYDLIRSVANYASAATTYIIKNSLLRLRWLRFVPYLLPTGLLVVALLSAVTSVVKLDAVLVLLLAVVFFTAQQGVTAGVQSMRRRYLRDQIPGHLLNWLSVEWNAAVGAAIRDATQEPATKTP